MFAGLDPVTVELTLFTDALVIRGSVTTSYRRVTDILNRAEDPFLVLDAVTIEEYGARGQSLSLPFAQVNLDSVLFATADIPVEANPSMRVVKTPRKAMISVPPFSVAGNVHLLTGEGDPKEGLKLLTESFVPVTDATYWSDQLGEGRRQALLVAVNHRRVQYIAPHHEVDPWAGVQVRVANEAGSASEAGSAGEVASATEAGSASEVASATEAPLA
jgi:hypothetical protein